MAAKSGHTLINILEVKPLYTDKYKGTKYSEDIHKNYLFLVLSEFFSRIVSLDFILSTTL